MRKSAKAILLLVVSLFGSIALTIGAAFTAALAYGAVALIVPGTGTPNANIVENYRQHARDYYFQGTACSNTTNCPDSALTGINYPASFFPLVIFPGWCRSGPEGCDKWDESVGQGVNGGPLGVGLNSALRSALLTGGTPGERDIIVFGYSQGGAVVSKTLNEANLSVADKQRIQVVTIGGIENPDGGLWQRLAFLNYIPFLDVTFAPPMPIDKDLKTTTIGFQYDPVVYAPRYWGNPLAMLNAIAALDNVHGYYLVPNGNDGATPSKLPYGYTPPGATGPNLNPLEAQLDCSVTGHPENCRYDSVGNTYIMIPATSLPLFNLVSGLLPTGVQPLVKPFIDLIAPVTKVLVDLGYDFSGDPGTPTPLSILPFNPFQNWLGVGLNLIAASIQGVQAFVNDLGGLTGSALVAPNAVQNKNIQAVGALNRLAVQSDDEPQAKLAKQNAGTPVIEQTAGQGGDGDGVTKPGTDQPTTPVVVDPVTPVVVDQHSAETDVATDVAPDDAAAAAAKVAAEKAAADAKAAADVKDAAEKDAADAKAAAEKKEADAKKAAEQKAAEQKDAEQKAAEQKAAEQKDAAEAQQQEAKEDAAEANKPKTGDTHTNVSGADPGTEKAAA